MSRPKKEYNNVFSVMMEYHNNIVVPFIKTFNNAWGGFRIKSRRCISRRDQLEKDNPYINYQDLEHMYEYILMNNFIVQFLNQEEYNKCLSLTRSGDQSNIIIGANLLYKMIEDKKLEIQEKLKNE